MNSLKKLFVSFMCILMSGFLFAASSGAVATSSDLSSLDLRDYIPTEIGKTYEYATVENTSEGTTNSTDTYHVVECDTPSINCIGNLYEDGTHYEYFLSSEEIKMTKSDDTVIDVPSYSKEDITVDLLDDDYMESIGLDPTEFTNFSTTCTHLYMSEFEFGGLALPTIAQECDLFLTHTESGDFTANYIEYIMEGYGTVWAGMDMYFGDIVVYSTSQELVAVYTPPAFSDLNYTHGNYDAIMYLYEEEIIGGYPDGTFQADKTINRAELLKILVEGNGVTPDTSVYHDCFDDVKTDWYAKYVCYATEQGWVEGYPDGQFRPADTVNKVEALKMLLNSQDIVAEEPVADIYEDVPSDQWFAKYVNTSKNMGILEETGTKFFPDGDKARGGISENLYRLLTY